MSEHADEAPGAREDTRPESALEVCERSQAQLTAPLASRLGWPVTIFKRAVRRLLRATLVPQAQFNSGVMGALREGESHVEALSGVLERQAAEVRGEVDRSRAELDDMRLSLKTVLSERDAIRAQVDPMQQELNALRAQFGPMIEELEALRESRAGLVAELAGIGDRLAQSDEASAPLKAALAHLRAEQAQIRTEQVGFRERTEKIEGHMPELLRDVQSDMGEMRAVQEAQGRHLDEVAGELVATSEDIAEVQLLEQRIDSSLETFDERVRSLELRLAPLVDLDHFDFAKSYRGDEAALRRRMKKYAKLFGPVEKILDFGCGRGEFLEACGKLEIGAYGVDTDADMISHCRMKKLDVKEEDGLAHLRRIPNRSLDGIFTAQLIEHLTPAQIVEFVRLASEKLKRGSKIVIETINPNTFSAMRWFHLDPSHITPVPPDMLRFFLEQSRFEVQDVLMSSPVPEDEKLLLIKEDTDDPAVAGLVRTLNENGRRLNEAIFGYQDYAIVAER